MKNFPVVFQYMVLQDIIACMWFVDNGIH
jgi:hypothetical protein